MILLDATKKEIIDAYDKLQRKVDNFDLNKKPKETMFVGVFWIGHTWYQTGHHRQYNLFNPGCLLYILLPTCLA